MESLPILRVFAVLDPNAREGTIPQVIAFEIWDGANFLAACGTSAAVGPTIQSLLGTFIAQAVHAYPIGKPIAVKDGQTALALDDSCDMEQDEAEHSNVEVLTFTIDCDAVGQGAGRYAVSSFSVLDVIDEDLATFERNAGPQLLKVALASIDINRRLGWVERVFDRKRTPEAKYVAALTY